MSGWILDKSALERLGDSVDDALWAERIERGVVSMATVTRLEIGYSARSGEHLRRIFSAPPVSSFLTEHLTPSMEERALEVQALLADRGLHRSPSISDLLVAAIAEARGLTVLHFDRAFKDIAGATGQPVEQLRV